MKATITKALATAGLVAAVGAVPLVAQGHPGHGHGDEAPRGGMMMHQMMGGEGHGTGAGMMGPHAAGCPMMGPMRGGADGEHRRSGHPGEVDP